MADHDRRVHRGDQGADLVPDVPLHGDETALDRGCSRQHLDRSTGDTALGRPVTLSHLRNQVLDPVEGRAA